MVSTKYRICYKAQDILRRFVELLGPETLEFHAKGLRRRGCGKLLSHLGKKRILVTQSLAIRTYNYLVIIKVS